MKKLFITFILSYLLSTTNSTAENTNNTKNTENEILKIGVLVPLSGEFKEMGVAILNSVKLALQELGEKNIKIYPKDNQADAEITYLAAKEFEKQEIKLSLVQFFMKI